MDKSSDRIRVLIHSRNAGVDILRTLASLSGQSVGSRRLNIVIATPNPMAFETREAELLHAALDFGSVRTLDAGDMPPARAFNLAALCGDEQWLLPVRVGTRLAPRFIARCLERAEAMGAQAVHSAHTAGSPGCTPLTRIRPFTPERLSRCNPVGPAALVRREAWADLGGLRPGLRLYAWDFWLRLTMSGRVMVRAPELLAHARPRPNLPERQEGQAKALLVVATPGAFEPDVCRWALALLRGATWARPFANGFIPTGRDVRDMFAGLDTTLVRVWPGPIRTAC